jgi:UMF1 family MFS transporter
VPDAGAHGIVGWLSFQWAMQPVQSVILTFVFAPYFASHVVADGVTGQSLWGLVTAASGVIIATLSPLLGAIADRGGALKPWAATFSLCIVLGCATLWLAVPGGAAPVPLILSAVVLITVSLDFTKVVSNALMTRLVPPDGLGRLSGWGFSAAYLGGVTALMLLLLTLVAPPDSGHTLLGTPPLFGLAPEAFEGERAAGWFVALWFVLFALPLFLLTPDRPSTGVPLAAAVGRTILGLGNTVAEIGRHRQLICFLAANMVIKNALAASATFGGIYAAAVFDWPVQTVGLYGVLLVIAAATGAFLAAFVDRRFGSWLVCVVAVALFTVAMLGILSVTPHGLLFWIEIAPPQPGRALFGSPAEMAFLAFGFVLGASGGPIFAASRSMLGQMAPADRLAQYFGLFAFSGKVTVFVGPLLVGIATAWTDSQRLGLSSILLLLLVGLGLLMRVGPPRRLPEGGG